MNKNALLLFGIGIFFCEKSLKLKKPLDKIRGTDYTVYITHEQKGVNANENSSELRCSYLSSDSQSV